MPWNFSFLIGLSKNIKSKKNIICFFIGENKGFHSGNITINTFFISGEIAPPANQRRMNTTMKNQPHDGSSTESFQHDASTTHHPASKSHQVNEFTSSEPPNRTTKRSRADWEGEESSSSSSSSSSSISSSSSAAPVPEQIQVIAPLPISLCKIKEDVLRLLMTYVLADDLNNIPYVNKCFNRIVHSYLEQCLMKSTFCIPKDFSTLNRSFEILELLTTLSNYDPKKKVTLKLKNGVHEVVGEWTSPHGSPCQQMLSVTCNTLSIIGEDREKTTINGGFLVEHGESLSITGVTIKNPRGFGLVASGKIKLRDVTIGECQYNGVTVRDGELDATECHFCHNGYLGVGVRGSTTTARLANCTAHHNKRDGVQASFGAVVDLMGEGTSVHNNEGNGLCAYSRGSTINVYRPCVLGDVSHGNKRMNINRGLANRGTIQQKDI